MVVKGRPRGNAPQLADYLLSKGENENITILDVDGRAYASEGYLKNVLYSMELNSELTRTNRSVYHAMLNPDEKQDRVMTAEDWKKSADILAKHLTFEQQRRVIVLHEKKGRVHAHVVFERYDHEQDKMIDYKNNYKAHDKARFEIEKELGHTHTPQKNTDRPQHKKTLTELWKECKSGAEFVKRAKECGYEVAKGTDRPFRVVDEKGISFDLVRQLDGVKTKEVRERLGDLSLMDDKKAIELMSSPRKEKQSDVHKPDKAKQTHITEPKQESIIITKTTVKEEIQQVPQVDKQNEADTEREKQRQAFIEEMRRTKEQAERQRGLFRTFCISAILMLRIVVERYQVSDRVIVNKFNQNTACMVSNVPNQSLGFVEASQYYEPL